ncbi:MAG: hypothetical protein KDK63_05695 [Chlamydiia bacterium]|nr:hypothetical protein [Chlamydiia bacterium]MCB1115211.1 hypothetical protein [Chlamydiia bacterium]
MRLLALFLLPLFLFAKVPFFATFDPPEGWVIGDPSKYGKGIQVGFIQSNRKVFTPSITLAFEPIGNTDQNTYVSAAKSLFIKRGARVQELGSFESKSGKGVLLQIDEKKGWGEVRTLQAITLHEHTAIIHSAAILKEDFLKFHETLLKSFQSLALYPNLAASCPDKKLQEKIDGMLKCWKKYRSTANGDACASFSGDFFQNNQWKPFVNYVEKELNSQGSCWQILAINHMKETLIRGEEK